MFRICIQVPKNDLPQRYSLFLLLPLFLFVCVYMSGGKAVCLCCIAFIFISLIICVGRFGGEPCVFISVEFSSVFIR